MSKKVRASTKETTEEKTRAAAANFGGSSDAKTDAQPQQPQQTIRPKLPQMTGPQKAAAVIVSLGADKASQIYKYMEPEDVETLTLEVARLGYLNSEQTEEVLSEFYELCLTNKAITEGGLEYAKTVLEKAFGEQTAASLLEKVEKSMRNKQFSFLDKADAKALFSALQYERPQTIALILSYVSAEKSAGVVEQLEPSRQIKVVENIARMESPSPTALKIIEMEMGRRFSTIISNKNVKVGGIDFVANLMNNIDRTSEKSIFDGLASYNQELAEEIRKRMFVFEDLVNMDDRSVQRFLRDCDPRDIVLALKSTTEDVANKLFANMSTRMAQNIKDDLEITTNVRMKDVEEAQQRIVDIIRKLEEQNEIIIIKGGKDDIIA